MTPHLHPRSRLTTSLFGTTLLVSFLVVGMPHILPCPAPRVKFADSEVEITEDGKRRTLPRPVIAPDGDDPDGEAETMPSHSISEEEKELMRKKSHECPVPKPRGLIGGVLGFKKEETAEKLPNPRIEMETSKSRREVN